MTIQLDKLQVQRQFDRSAYSYDKVAGMQRHIVDNLINGMNLESTQGCLVDLGCGTGYALEKIAQVSNLKLHGLDLAPSMLIIAQTLNPDAVLIEGDIECLPYQDNSFDTVFSSSAIQWCEISSALSEIKRIAKQDAQISISSFLHGTLEQWRAIWMTEAERENHDFLSIDVLQNTFQAAGFKNIEIKTERYEQSFADFKQAANSIRELGAGNASSDKNSGLMSRAKYQQIRTKVEALKSENGEIVLPYEIVYIQATVDKRR